MTNKPKNIPIILIIMVLSVIVGYIISFLYKLLKTNLRVGAIIIGLIMVAASIHRLYQLNTEPSDGFLSLGRMMEVFFFGIIGGGLLVSTIIK